VNIDVFANTRFGDEEGLKTFFLAHRFIHEQTGLALSQKFKVPVNTYGVSDALAQEAWIARMQSKEGGPIPKALADWLFLHSQMHVNTYILLGQSDTAAPDLSNVDFGNPQQFDDWMSAHQQMHDFEQSQLGLN
jgi:hypothetical protein